MSIEKRQSAGPGRSGAGQIEGRRICRDSPGRESDGRALLWEGNYQRPRGCGGVRRAL